MPKRRNPFSDNSSPQLKTHVRDKEVNTGISRQTRMQAVYDRTQQLLFTGMKEMQDRHVALDVNENCLPYKDVTMANRSDLKQMHLNKSCQLVESTTIMDMDADSNSCHDSVVHHSLTHSLDTSPREPDASGACVVDSCSIVLQSFGKSFGRSPAESSPLWAHSPLPSTSSSASCLWPIPDVVSSSNDTGNAFSLMKQAQCQKATVRDGHVIQACHNCRQPVKSLNVARCQFCEKTVCCTCFRQCAGCHLGFCQLCSVINYDLPVERAFCLNCQDR